VRKYHLVTVYSLIVYSALGSSNNAKEGLKTPAEVFDTRQEMNTQSRSQKMAHFAAYPKKEKTRKSFSDPIFENQLCLPAGACASHLETTHLRFHQQGVSEAMKSTTL